MSLVQQNSNTYDVGPGSEQTLSVTQVNNELILKTTMSLKGACKKSCSLMSLLNDHITGMGQVHFKELRMDAILVKDSKVVAGLHAEGLSFADFNAALQINGSAYASATQYQGAGSRQEMILRPIGYSTQILPPSAAAPAMALTIASNDTCDALIPMTFVLTYTGPIQKYGLVLSF